MEHRSEHNLAYLETRNQGAQDTIGYNGRHSGPRGNDQHHP